MYFAFLLGRAKFLQHIEIVMILIFTNALGNCLTQCFASFRTPNYS